MWWTHERRGHAANDSLETSIARQAGSQKARSPFKDSIPQLTLIVAVRIAWIFISDNNCLLPRHILAPLPTTGTDCPGPASTGSAASPLQKSRRTAGRALTHSRPAAQAPTRRRPPQSETRNNPTLLLTSIFSPTSPLKGWFI